MARVLRPAAGRLAVSIRDVGAFLARLDGDRWSNCWLTMGPSGVPTIAQEQLLARTGDRRDRGLGHVGADHSALVVIVLLGTVVGGPLRPPGRRTRAVLLPGARRADLPRAARPFPCRSGTLFQAALFAGPCSSRFSMVFTPAASRLWPGQCARRCSLRSRRVSP